MAADPRDVDVVIVGSGHNGLVAAGYLARAGLRVRLLERLGHVGGAAVSAQIFDGVHARLSRYAYLVSLLPTRIVDDLGATVRLARRPYSSYTPDPAAAGRTGLLIGPHCTFDAVGAHHDERAFATFYQRCRLVTERLWPTLLEPLRSRHQARARVADGDAEADAAWQAMVDRPIGHAIADALDNDLVRGVVATDALIGTFAALDDPSLQQNVCFLYHLIGGGAGEWQVPVGGMGAVSAALAAAAVDGGAEIVTGAEVYAVDPNGEVRYRRGDDDHLVRGRFVLAGVTPAALAGLLGEPASAPAAPGAQVKINMVLRRLPRLRDDSVTPEQAFGGTLHVNETWTQLNTAYSRAAGHALPDPLPCEIYCHSLTDPSILSPALRESGAHTLTVFGLHTPHSAFGAARDTLTDAVLSSLNSVLAEPIQDVLLDDANGLPCIETTTTLDLERTLGMTGGNIFHGGLSWPFANDDERLDTPARQWGVATAHERILLCGSGARRGGAVSGIGGHNAAMAVRQSCEAG
ncbi:MAG TPA: NAD(P)/FAD-dependent oxidoreductase [Mycobacterium sp.]|nr:NAD(P)/FAD-dependent oxidoreductase [Mycobacterium sp.]